MKALELKFKRIPYGHKWAYENAVCVIFPPTRFSGWTVHPNIGINWPVREFKHLSEAKIYGGLS